MKNLKKDLNNAGQSTIEVKKSQKHDANLQKKLNPVFSNRVDSLFAGYLWTF